MEEIKELSSKNEIKNDNDLRFRDWVEVTERLGVQLKNSDGSYRPLFNVLRDLAMAWEGIYND